MDARGDAALGGGHHVRAHELGRDRGAPAVAGEARVGVLVEHPRRVRARDAVEELLGAGSAQQLARQARLQRLDALVAPHVLREQVGAHGKGALGEKSLVYVLVDVVGAGDRGERHVTDARDALAEAPLEVVSVGAHHAVARQGLEHLRDVDHARRLTQDSRESPVGVALEGAARGRDGACRDVELLEATRVDPERMQVAGVHGHGSVGEGRVERRARGRDGRVPQVLAPALADEPAAGLRAVGEGAHLLDAVGLARARAGQSEVGVDERRVEDVLVGVMEAGTDEGVAIVAHAGVVAGDARDVLRRADRADACALDDDGRADVRVGAVEIDVVRRDDAERGHGFSSREAAARLSSAAAGRAGLARAGGAATRPSRLRPGCLRGSGRGTRGCAGAPGW